MKQLARLCPPSTNLFSNSSLINRLYLWKTMIKSRTCEWKQPQIVRVCIPKSLIAPLIPVVYEVFRLQCFHRSLCALTVALCGCFCFSGRQFRDSVRFRRRGQSSDRGPFYRSPSGRRQKVMKTQLNVKAGKKSIYPWNLFSTRSVFILAWHLTCP